MLAGRTTHSQADGWTAAATKERSIHTTLRLANRGGRFKLCLTPAASPPFTCNLGHGISGGRVSHTRQQEAPARPLDKAVQHYRKSGDQQHLP